MHIGTIFLVNILTVKMRSNNIGIIGNPARPCSGIACAVRRSCLNKINLIYAKKKYRREIRISSLRTCSPFPNFSARTRMSCFRHPIFFFFIHPISGIFYLTTDSCGLVPAHVRAFTRARNNIIYTSMCAVYVWRSARIYERGRHCENGIAHNTLIISTLYTMYMCEYACIIYSVR